MDAAQVEAHLRKVGLPTRVQQIPGWNADAQAMLSAIKQDKKVSRGTLTFILTRGIGKSFIARDVDEADVTAFLAQELAG